MFRSSCLRPFCIRFSLLLMQNKGPFCIDLGSFLVPFWCHGALRGACREFSLKSWQNNIYMGSLWATFGPLWSPSGLHLGRFGVPLRPFGGQNGANIGSKSRKKSIKTCTSIPHLFLHRFFTDICSPARRTEPPKSWKSSTFYSIPAFEAFSS